MILFNIIMNRMAVLINLTGRIKKESELKSLRIYTRGSYLLKFRKINVV